MPRFKLTRVYTPNDPFKQREFHEHEFSSIDSQPYIVAHTGNGFYEAQMAQVRAQVAPDATYPIEFGITDHDHNYRIKIERLPDTTETPATEANVIKWAEAQVALTPTVRESQWDALKKRTIEVTVPNTVEKELVCLLISNDAQNLENDDNEDLRDTILHLYKVGVKGYESMTREELLDQISNEIIDPTDAQFLEEIEAFDLEDDE